MRVKVEHGDSREVLKGLADGSVASIVTDPPYSLQTINKRFAKVGRNDKTWSKSGPHQRTAAGFMNQKWDTGETAFDPEFWAEALRVLKPGGHVLAFGGTRTYHRLVCAIEDAGFEIRDSIGWLFGSGFPKSHNVAKGIDKANGDVRPVLAEGEPVKRMIPGADQNKAGWEKNNGREFVPTVTAAASAAWEGWGTALKPAMELICVGRKPLIGTVAANVLEHGTGALNIDGCRVPLGDNEDSAEREDESSQDERYTLKGSTNFAAKPGRRIGSPAWGGPMKRLSAVPGQIGELVARTPPADGGRWPANVVHDGSDEVVAAFPMTSSGAGAVKKASAGDRLGNQGSAYGAESRPAGTPMISIGDAGSAARFFYSSKADADDRLGSKHPTVKPVDLMRWLVRLITPPGGLVLDPFAGSGTTGMACLAEGLGIMLLTYPRTTPMFTALKGLGHELERQNLPRR